MGDISQKDSAHTVRGVPLFDGCGIDHVGIRYRDLKKAVGWFRDTLGLPVDHEARTMAFVRVGGDGSHLALFQAEGDEPLRSRGGLAHCRRSAPSPRAQLGLPGSGGERLPLYALALAPARRRSMGSRIETVGAT